jgi:ankyrin repeat protein
MKIPFFKTKEIPKLTFEELIELLRVNDFEKLRHQKQKGQNFTATDSYDGINILEYYIKNHSNFKYDKVELVTFLISCGIEINHKGNKRADENSALHLCIYKKDLELVKILLELNAEIEIQDKYGNTPLMRAIGIYRGEVEVYEIIKFLIKNGASLEKKNFHDINPKQHILNVGGGIDAGFNKKEWDLRELI